MCVICNFIKMFVNTSKCQCVICTHIKNILSTIVVSGAYIAVLRHYNQDNLYNKVFNLGFIAPKG